VSFQDPEEIKRRIGRNLTVARNNKGLTREQFAGDLQATVQWLSRVERGEENLTLNTMAKLSNALEVTIEDLLRVHEDQE